MHKEDRYLTDGDVNMRWNHTVANYKGKWYYAAYYDSKILSLCDIVTGALKTNVDGNDEELLLATPELGYVNFNQFAIYVSRATWRKQKQGACCDNMFQQVLGGSDSGLTNQIFRSQGFKDMLEGTYQTYHMCHAILSSNQPSAQSIAFSRDYALMRGEENAIDLFFKGKNKIGTKTKSGDVFKLIPRYDNSVVRHNLAAYSVPI